MVSARRGFLYDFDHMNKNIRPFLNRLDLPGRARAFDGLGTLSPFLGGLRFAPGGRDAGAGKSGRFVVLLTAANVIRTVGAGVLFGIPVYQGARREWLQF